MVEEDKCYVMWEVRKTQGRQRSSRLTFLYWGSEVSIKQITYLLENQVLFFLFVI